MKLADLPPEVLARIKKIDYDQILEKHEGPESWEACLQFHEPEIMRAGGYHILLPVAQDQHKNITILRVVASDDGNVLTIFLKNTTFVDDLDDDFLFAGYMAVCEKIGGTELYIATVYHEWFIVENPDLRQP